MRYLLFFVIVFMFLMNCDKDNPASPPSVINTETWKLLDKEFPDNNAEFTFNLLSDSTVSVGGKWVYDFWDYLITCTFLCGNATIKNDTSFTITAKGTACYPPNEDGKVESSPFTLKMDGTFSKGKAIGTWDISFSKKEWVEWGVDGEFIGTLQQGQGITKQ